MPYPGPVIRCERGTVRYLSNMQPGQSLSPGELLLSRNEGTISWNDEDVVLAAFLRRWD